MIVPARMPAAIRARLPTTVAMSVPYWANCTLMAFTWEAKALRSTRVVDDRAGKNASRDQRQGASDGTEIGAVLSQLL